MTETIACKISHNTYLKKIPTVLFDIEETRPNFVSYASFGPTEHLRPHDRKSSLQKLVIIRIWKNFLTVLFDIEETQVNFISFASFGPTEHLKADDRNSSLQN